MASYQLSLDAALARKESCISTAASAKRPARREGAISSLVASLDALAVQHLKLRLGTAMRIQAHSRARFLPFTLSLNNNNNNNNINNIALGIGDSNSNIVVVVRLLCAVWRPLCTSGKFVLR
jgi:hypothetical protein